MSVIVPAMYDRQALQAGGLQYQFRNSRVPAFDTHDYSRVGSAYSQAKERERHIPRCLDQKTVPPAFELGAWAQESCHWCCDRAAFTQPIQIRVEELISGVRATLAVKLYGEDLAVLDELSARIKQAVSTCSGRCRLVP